MGTTNHRHKARVLGWTETYNLRALLRHTGWFSLSEMGEWLGGGGRNELLNDLKPRKSDLTLIRRVGIFLPTTKSMTMLMNTTFPLSGILA